MSNKVLSKGTVVLGLLPLYDYYERYVKPIIGPMGAITDPQEIIIGEVYLLMGLEHEPNQATLRKLVYTSVPSEVRQDILSKFNKMAYEILRGAEAVQSDYVEVVPIDGYALAVKPYMPEHHSY